MGPEELLYASLPSPASFKMIEQHQPEKNQAETLPRTNSSLNLKRALSQSYTKLAPNSKNVPVIDDLDYSQQQESFSHRPRTRTKTISRQNSK